MITCYFQQGVKILKFYPCQYRKGNYEGMRDGDFLPACPASQAHDSNKGRVILNHESAAGHNKNCGEKSAFSICNFR